jgi:PAS domain S-box-containing protein
MSRQPAPPSFVVHGTAIVPSDTGQQYREKIARITLDSMVQFVGLLDAEGTVVEINKVALDAVGVKLSDVQGKPFWTTFWWQVSEEANQGIRDAIARAAKGEFVRWDTPLNASADGSVSIIIDASLMPVTDDAGKVVFICAEGRDITAKKAQEREIAEKNIELQGLLERIRELDEIKTQFFANVSHELRTPLALILGPAQRLIDDTGTLSLTQRRESGQVVARNARMLLKHVNDLLDMSKIEARKLKIDLQDGDVAAQVRFLASHFAVLAADRRIEYTVDADGPCIAAVDPDKLQRVVMNLLGNAFKFVPDGGRVRCSLRHSPEAVTIAVDDSGPGVPPELRQGIFERFRQGDGGINRTVGGTGLGLAIAKEFVEMHKGRLDVLDSDLGGARFEINLPLHRVGAGEAVPDAAARLDRGVLDGVLEELRVDDRRPKAAPASAPASAARPRVLVVEDNPDMSRFVAESLSREYDVATASDGRDGLEQALRFNPMIVVSDIMMPNVSGVEMVAQMRAHPELRRTPILLLSAKADEALMAHLLDNGAQDFIVKPFSERDLQVRVRNLVLGEQAREATDLQKRLLHSVFMQAPLLIAVLRGPEHVIELANPPMCEQIWQRPESELLNRPLFDVIPELGEQNVRPLLREVYETGVPYVGRETAVQFDRGGGVSETLWFDFIYSAFRDMAGEIEGIFVVASEVTAQVTARQQVNGLRVQAEIANRAKDEFLAMLGHELRNPLSPILTALQLMKLRGEPDSERERTVIERQVNHLTRLVDDLLDVSRIARGRIELKTELVEMSEVVANALEMASPLLEQRTHRLRVDVPRHGLQVDGDATRLGQVVSNLLTNAAKYTPAGGQVTVHAQAVDDEVVVSVRDTGIGITPDVLPHVFDLFVQERQALDRSQGGLGIGLTIVRSLIERHGGSVAAHSAGSGKGSEFIVRLPKARGGGALASPAPAPGSAVARVAGRGGARVLVVDDNEDGAELLAMAISSRGYTTRIAHDAPTALRVAAEFLPHVAFLDIGLPVMDGYELAAHLRTIPGLPEVQLVALTGYGQESDRQKTRAAGFLHHLVKPVDLDAVEATLVALEVRGDG